MRIVLQTPWGLALALLGALPVGIALWREWRARGVRAVLRVGNPPLRTVALRPALLALAFLLFGLAAARPLIRTQDTRRARKDAQLMLVLDDSRSMLASLGRHGTPRWQRALAAAEKIHAATPEVPVGVAALNDRVLPYLFPTTSDAAFELVLHRAYTIDRPAPSASADVTTSFTALDSFATHNFFSRDTSKKVAVVLTDGETRTYDPFSLTNSLRAVGIQLVYVRFWNDRERIPAPDGRTETYQPINPSVLGFAQTDNARLFPEAQLHQAIADIRKRLGSGPTHEVASQIRDVSFGPQLALLGLCALLLVVVPGIPLPPRPRRRRAAALRRAQAPAPVRPTGAATRA